MASESRIAAVVVTYNRAIKLSKVIDCICAQELVPGRIFVVDNASTDNTQDMIAARRDPRIEYVKLSENRGGAAGFNLATRLAYEGGFEYVWLMDDDGYPEPGALRILVESIEEFPQRFGVEPAFACSNVRWTNGDLCEMNTPATAWDWPRFYSDDLPVILVNSCSFVSVLIPRRSIKQHGLPIKDYFIWFDDAEYTQRLARHYPGIFCPRSIIVHDIVENKGVNFSLIGADNVWKFRYGARNQASFHFESGIMSGALFCGRVLKEMSRGHVPWKFRLQIIHALVNGAVFRPRREMVV